MKPLLLALIAGTILYTLVAGPDGLSLAGIGLDGRLQEHLVASNMRKARVADSLEEALNHFSRAHRVVALPVPTLTGARAVGAESTATQGRAKSALVRREVEARASRLHGLFHDLARGRGAPDALLLHTIGAMLGHAPASPGIAAAVAAGRSVATAPRARRCR